MTGQLHASLTSPQCQAPDGEMESMLPLDSGVVEKCSVMVLCLAVWRASLGLADARRMLSIWLHCANCKVYWVKNNNMGLFLKVGQGPLHPMKGNPNASTYWGIVDNAMFLICGNSWKFQHVLMSVYLECNVFRMSLQSLLV